MRILFILSFLALSSGVNACGNEYGYNLDGDRVFTRYFYLSERHRTFDKAQLRERLNEKKAIANPTHEDLSDMALYLMKLGETKKALKILEPLAAKHPDEYIIIANLGTAYELDGQLDNALKMIKKGFEINEDSHLGSEWVHIKILEAKIKDKQRPGWLKTNSIIDIEDLHNTAGVRPHPMRDNHLEFQIRTRVAFTPAPNLVMANLLESLAKYNEKYGSYENAILAYTYVLEFSETMYKKRLVSNDIIALNKKRRESGIAELNPMFKLLIERGEIDPQLMLYGINDLAEQLDEQDEHDFMTRDSIRTLQAQVDSLSNNVQGETNEGVKKESTDSGALWGVLFGIIGLVLGSIIAVVAMKRRKTS